MIGTGCVYDRIRLMGGLRDYFRVIEISENRFNPTILQQGDILSGPDQAHYVMT
jgi:hypothetical protein